MLIGDNLSLNENEKNDKHFYIDTKTRSIRDSENRHLIMHGVNVVYKEAPYLPIMGDDISKFDPNNSLIKFDMQNLKKWGMNHVRLGVTWESVERQPGIYDYEYLDKVEELINQLGEFGIYTMVDAHQDVMARIACGEGIPDFYAK